MSVHDRTPVKTIDKSTSPVIWLFSLAFFHGKNYKANIELPGDDFTYGIPRYIYSSEVIRITGMSALIFPSNQRLPPNATKFNNFVAKIDYRLYMDAMQC